MAAVPLYDYEPIGDDPDDPAEILRVLPKEHHEQFLAEYGVAVVGARDVDHYRDLHYLLRRWRLLATALSRPDFAESLQSVRESSRTGSPQGTLTLDEVIAARARRS